MLSQIGELEELLQQVEDCKATLWEEVKDLCA